MTIFVEFILNKEKSPGEIDIKSGATVGELIEMLEIKNHEDFFIIVNNTNRFKDYMLKEGDTVKFFPAMSGG